MGYEGRTASSTVPDEAVPRIRAAGGHVKAGVKPRTTTVEQLPSRRPEARPGAPEEGNGQVDADAAILPELQGGTATEAAVEPQVEPTTVSPPTGGVRSPRGGTGPGPA